MVRRTPELQTEVAVPFVNLDASCRPLNAAILADIADLLDSTGFHYGPQVAEFEDRFAAYCGTAACVGMSSGLDALRLALLAAGIEPGDEVIVPANTFIGTFAAVHQAGGIPVPADDERSRLQPRSGLWSRTRHRPDAVCRPRPSVRPTCRHAIVVGVGGLGLVLIEDACQAHGAERDGTRAGVGGRAAAFSFYPSKNLGAAGDAGAVVTSDGGLATRLYALRHHGERERYYSEVEGYTARLDTIQAIVLLHKLPHLDRWTDERRAAAAFYTDALAGVGDLRLPPTPPDSNPVWHLYVVRTGEPAALARHLAERRSAAVAIIRSRLTSLARLGGSASSVATFPVTEAIAAEGLSLPLFPGITEAQLEAVTSAVADYFG